MGVRDRKCRDDDDYRYNGYSTTTSKSAVQYEYSAVLEESVSERVSDVRLGDSGGVRYLN